MINNQTNLVESLRKEAKNNPVFGAVCLGFATRERARHQVTIHSLKQKMDGEGYKFKKEQYQQMLNFLSKLGIGKLDFDPKGRIRALKDVKVTLQSLGQAALTKKDALDSYKARNKYGVLHAEAAAAAKKPAAIKTPQSAGVPVAKKPVDRSYPVGLTVMIKGKPINVRIPTDLSAQDIAELVVRLQESSK